jgi:hypothetical protein
LCCFRHLPLRPLLLFMKFLDRLPNWPLAFQNYKHFYPKLEIENIKRLFPKIHFDDNLSRQIFVK